MTVTLRSHGLQLDVALDRSLPQSADAERAVLGSIMILNAAYHRVSNLSTDDFFTNAHRIIYAAMAKMAQDGMEIELLTLKEELVRQNRLEEAGGTAYLSGLLDVVPDVANVERYAAIVERLSRKRALIVAGNSIMREALDPESEPDDIAAGALASLGRQATKEDQQARPFFEVLSEAYRAMDRLRAEDRSVALMCGWPTFDAHKIFSPTLIVCGGASNAGKSALMVSLADSLAVNGHRVAMISLESTEREIGLRYTSAITGIPHGRVRDWRTFSDRDFAAVAACQASTAKKGIFVGRGPRNAEDIVLELKRLRAVEGIECAFLDYIQLVDLKRRVENREERFAEIAKMLLGTANDLGMSIFALSQLNEDRKTERGGRLSFSDLAYAKAIGKSARTVLLFQRPYADDPTGPAKDCYVSMAIAKNAEERIHEGFEAHFAPSTQRFAEGNCEANGCRSLDAGRIVQRKLI